MKKIYSTKNDQGTLTKYKKSTLLHSSTYIGTCAAQTVLVLHNFELTIPEHTKPDQHKALILQAYSEFSTNNLIDFTIKITEVVGLKIIGTPKVYFSIKSAITHTAFHIGRYLICIHEHIVAIINRPSDLYLFDANYGLFYEKKDELLYFVDDATRLLSQYKMKQRSSDVKILPIYS